MLNLKPFGVKRIISIFLITILLFSGLISISFLNNQTTTPNTETINNIFETSDSTGDETKIQKEEYVEVEPASKYIHQTSNEVVLFNFEKKSIDDFSTNSRSNGGFEYDIGIQTINITYPGLIPWPVSVGGITYWYFIAGGIGEKTNFSITIRNFGKNYVHNDDKAVLIINLTDYFGYSSWEQKEYLGHILPNNEFKVNFTWIPIYSNSYNLTCNISFEKDQNISNNNFKMGNLNVKKWDDDLEDGNINDWGGDIDQNKWHLTDSVEADPNPNSHSNKFTFYHGLEQDGQQDDYGERNDFDLITPEIDLRRFNPVRPAFLNFKFYGNSTINKDKFTIEGYKSSENKWYPIEIKFYGGGTVDKDTNEPTWLLWKSGVYIGIPIDAYAGELARFKIHWESDLEPEDKTGFYLDDFFIYGFERPPPMFDVGIEDVEIISNTKPMVVGQEFKVCANITNYGTNPISNFKVNIDIQDFTGRQEPAVSVGSDIITKLEPDESSTMTWRVKPSVGGIYFINVSTDFPLDEIKENNKFSLTETAEIYIYYNSFESVDQSWLADPGWSRLNVGMIDPDPTQHSYSTAWYVGNATSNLVDPNMTSCLYSPIIDLDGAQSNLAYGGDQIRIDFKWFGRASKTDKNNDKLYFEYALDLSNNWTLLNTPDKKNSIISGEYSNNWYTWDTLGTEELFVHHIQFRWRFESDSNFAPTEIGYYIDDFTLWVVQEQYGRPIISGCEVRPRAVINDSRDEVLISCEVEKGLFELDEVYINLESIGGPVKQLMFDNSKDGDLVENDNIYTIKVTVPPTISKGEKILRVTALDTNKNFDNNYLKIIIKENLPPIIESTSPANRTVVLNENDGLEFSILATDPEGGDLKYSWYLDSVLKPQWTDNFFKFNSSFKGDFSAGNYSLGVQVMDNGLPGKTDYFEWSIEVKDVLPDFAISKKNVLLKDFNVTEGEVVEIQAQMFNLQPPPENNVTVYFIQQSTNGSIPNSTFSIHNINLFKGRASTYITTYWLANSSYDYIKVWIDPDNNITEFNEDNNIAIIPINVTQRPDPIVPNPGIKEPKTREIPTYLYIFSAGIIAILISFAFAIGTEFGKYRLFAMFAPLYYRVTGDKILEHELRSKIYMYIRAHPGDHYRSIMQALDLKNGTLVHHLSRLEQEELIKSERDGYFKRFYPVGMKIPKSDVGMYYPEAMPTYNIGEHQVSEIQLKIINTIRKHAGLTQKEIAYRINESRRVVNYHIKLLLQHELVRVVKRGRKTECYISEKATGS